MAVVLLIDFLWHLIFFSIGPSPVLMDAAGYRNTGTLVSRADYFQETVNTPYRTPVYPYFLSLGQFKCSNNALLVSILGQHCLVFITTLLTCLLAVCLTGRHDSFVLCYLLLFPLTERVWYANAVLTESLFALPLTTGLAILLLYELRPTKRVAGLAGFLLGFATVAATWTNPTAVFRSDTDSRHCPQQDSV